MREGADMGGSGWWRATLLVASVAFPSAGNERPSVAFFYGKPLPLTELSHFNWVVVQPENLDAAGLAELHSAGVQVFAYLSVGEAAPDAVEPAWILGSNTAWNSAIMNPAAAGWRERVLHRADALWKSGYRGLFLDTLDSYLAALPGVEARRAAAAALALLIRDIHDRRPGLKLFFNRGFEILDEVGGLAAAVAAESLLFGWDAAKKRYVEIPDHDRKWLAGQLQKVKERFGIPVVVIDYLPPARRAAAREAARRIDAMGFTPWIATPALDVLGVGALEVFPRRMLLLYDGAEAPSLEETPIHRLAALPVEHLGYVPDYLDVRRGLPRESLSGRYAGIVTWFTDDELPDSLGYPQWLLRQMEAGLPVAMLGRPGFNVSGSFLKRLGLTAAPTPPLRPIRLVQRDDLVGLEAEPHPRSRGLLAWRAADPDLTVHLRLADALDQTIDPIVTAPWGGVALDPYVLDIGYQGRARWILDPFAFLEKALALGPAPALDLTTENGARLLVVVADGDGFASTGGPSATPAGEVILRELFARLPVPTTVSIPPVELGAPGSQRSRSHLRAVAKAIFALPAVEPPGQAVRLSGGNPQDGGEPSLAQLSPSGCPSGDAFRIYLPGWNESGVSSWWAAADFDPARLRDLLERAETPRRLTPIGLYYPFSIASRPAALRSLEQTLRWTRERGALPLWSHEYAQRVLDFRSASMARTLDGAWQFRGLGKLRTVRLPRSLGWPDLQASEGVASIADVGDARYVSFGPGESATLALSDEPARGTWLSWANAPLDRWSAGDHAVLLRLHGHEPVRFAVGGSAAACTLTAGGRTIRPARGGRGPTFSLAGADTGDARLECRTE
jgi:hypothetical protein